VVRFGVEIGILKRAEWAYSRSERGGKEWMIVIGLCELCGLVSGAFLTSIRNCLSTSEELLEELFDWSIWRSVWRLWKSYLDGCLKKIWMFYFEAVFMIRESSWTNCLKSCLETFERAIEIAV
jgi:hypothetical protein